MIWQQPQNSLSVQIRECKLMTSKRDMVSSSPSEPPLLSTERNPMSTKRDMAEASALPLMSTACVRSSTSRDREKSTSPKISQLTNAGDKAASLTLSGIFQLSTKRGTMSFTSSTRSKACANRQTTEPENSISQSRSSITSPLPTSPTRPSPLSPESPPLTPLAPPPAPPTAPAPAPASNSALSTWPSLPALPSPPHPPSAPTPASISASTKSITSRYRRFRCSSALQLQLQHWLRWLLLLQLTSQGAFSGQTRINKVATQGEAVRFECQAEGGENAVWIRHR